MTDVETIVTLYPKSVRTLIDEVCKHGDPVFAVYKLGQNTWDVNALLAYDGDDPETLELSVELQMAQAEGEENRWEHAKDLFINVLSQHAIVQEAVAAQPWYKLKDFNAEVKQDPDFERRWQDAISAAKGAVLREAHRRAVEGTEEPTIHKGQFCYHTDPKTGELTQVRVRKYSDSLLLALIKGYFPDFEDKVTIKDHRPSMLAGLPQDKLDALYDALKYTGEDDGA